MQDMFLAIGGVILLVIGVFLLGGLVRAFVQQRIHCPEQEADYDVVLKRRLNGVWGFGPPVDVVSCSRFADPSQITCTKSCPKIAPRP